MRLPLGGHRQRLLLELDLTRPLREASPATPLEALRARHTPTLRAVVDALARAARDDDVVGLVAHVGRREPTLAQSGELRTAVRAFADAGKVTACWSESYGEELGPGTVAYHLASAFQEVWIQPSGGVGLLGVSAQAVFLRPALDKLGVEPQLGQRHEYKTAANTFLESAMTGPHREMVTRLAESATEIVVADVSAARGVPEQGVREAIEAAPLSSGEALDRGLVDRVGYRDEVYADLRHRLGDVELRFVERYSAGRPRVLAGVPALVTRRARPVIGVVEATGPIHLGRSRRPSPVSGHSVGSDSLGAALRAAGRDGSVKAVVLRIDSPGGSYAASDAIRREVLALRRAGTPVVASMAGVAASGGYFIAMPADVVVASPGTLTGSIGVLAGKQVLQRALERVGIHRETVAAAPHADMFSTARGFDEQEWERLQAWLDRVYDDFTRKAAEDRGMPLEDLQEVAKGRVWTGADAARVGLVDELGGLSEAVDEACARAGVRRRDAHVKVVPKVTLLERLRPASNSESPAAAVAVGAVGAVGAGDDVLADVLTALGLPHAGALTMPVPWVLR